MIVRALLPVVVFCLVTIARADDGNEGEAGPRIIARIGSNRWEHGGAVNGLALSLDGKLAASTGFFTANVVEVPSGKPLFALPTANVHTRALAFSGDGRMLLDGGARESHVSFWNLETRKIEREIRIHLAPAHALSLALSTDGRELAVAYEFFPRVGTVDCGVGVFDVATGRPRFQQDRILRCAIVPHGEGHDVLLVARDSQVVQRLEVGALLPTATDRKPESVPPVSVDANRMFHNSAGKPNERMTATISSRDGRTMAVGGSLGTVHVWRLDPLGEFQRLDPPRDNLWHVDVAFSSDGRHVLTTPVDKQSTAKATAWDAETGRQIDDLAELPAPFAAPTGPRRVEQRWEGIALFDGKTGAKLREFTFLPSEAKGGTSFTPYLASAIVSPNGKLVVGAGYFNAHLGLPPEELGPRVQIWNADNGKLISGYTEKERFLKAPLAVFSPDSKLLAVAMLDRVRLLDPTTGKLLHTLAGHHGAVRSLASSPDSRRLVTAADDNAVLVWRVDSAE